MRVLPYSECGSVTNLTLCLYIVSTWVTWFKIALLIKMSNISNFVSVTEMTSFIGKGLSYEEISDVLISKHPSQRGFSKRSIRRFCKENKINKNYSSNDTEKSSQINIHLREVNLFMSEICS